VYRRITLLNAVESHL